MYLFKILIQFISSTLIHYIRIYTTYIVLMVATRASVLAWYVELKVSDIFYLKFFTLRVNI